MSNQIIDPMSEQHTVGTKRPSDAHDVSTKKQKSSLDILKLGKPDCKLFVGKTNSFSESISKKLVTRLIDSGLLSTTRDGEWMDAAYNCSEKTHLNKIT
jgi:hypothetical protein